MRVLFVTHNFPRTPGDLPGNFLLRLARALRDAGVQVHVIAPHAAGLSETGTVDGFSVTRFRYASEKRETLAYGGTMAAQVKGSLGGKLLLARFIRAATRAVRAHREPVDVVHAHWWFPSGLAVTKSALGGRPMVTTLHGSDVRLARSAAARVLMKSVFARSAQVTAVSTWLAQESARLSQSDAPLVAPMPVEGGWFTPGTVSRDGVVFVGKLDAQKGAAVLLDALALLPKEINATIVGDGPDLRALHARAAALGVAGRVRWTGALPHHELPAYYQRARLYIAPVTEPEGLGLSAAEAIMCETPVVASNLGGLTDLVEDGVTGRLVAPRDPAALASAIAGALATPERLAVWGREGRTRLEAKFAPAACAAKYVEVYRQVTSGKA